MATKTTATESKNKVETLPTAHNLEEAVNSGNTLQGYAAMNDKTADSEISRVAADEQPSEREPYDEYREVSLRAYELYESRNGGGGSADDDWFQAEEEVRARRSSGRH